MSVGITEFQAVTSPGVPWYAVVGVAGMSAAGVLRRRVRRWPIRGVQQSKFSTEDESVATISAVIRPRNRRFPDAPTLLVLTVLLVLKVLLLAVGSVSAAPLSPAAPVVAITQTGADVLLSWPAQKGVSRFTAWQCEDPYCAQPMALISLVGHSTGYRVGGGLPGPGHVRTWFVTAQKGNVVSERSNLVGAFTYGLN